MQPHFKTYFSNFSIVDLALHVLTAGMVAGGIMGAEKVDNA